jgi:hypothetical protein
MTKREIIDAPVEMAEVVTARTVAEIGVSFLIEYVRNGEVFRVIMPKPYDGDAVELFDLELGIPYGLDWAAILKPANPTPADLARSLKNAGIFTASDAMTNPNMVISAILAVYGIDLAAVLTAASKSQEVK